MTNIRILVTTCFCFIGSSAFNQVVTNDTTKREAQITYIQDDNQVNFSAITPPLQQIPGAPAAFYSFYWEFGDGRYSFDPKPKHTYKKAGEHKAQLWTTNNYDNGKPPPSRPQKIPVKKITYEDNSEKIKSLDELNDFRLQINRSPVPEQEMVVIASYKNANNYPSNGKIYLFYNEKRFKASNFSLMESRTHHGEREVQDLPVVAANAALQYPDNLLASAANTPVLFFSETQNSEASLSVTLDESRSRYKDLHILEFNDVAPNEERNVFYSFQTTPEMLKDTNAIITIRGVYVPDRGKDGHNVRDMEMEIVTSHDPNKMSVSDARLNYRFVKNKELQFKVRFQNNGEGPARSIKLNVDVSDMFDKASLKVLDMYPPCPVCPDTQEVTFSCLDTTFTQGKIIFHFRNIYLPGSRQKNVDDKDSTRGFVKYALQFAKKVPKKNTLSRTAIIFDKNEPILTNYSSTRFKPGLSLGIKAGYLHLPTLNDPKSYFAGVTISPYKSHKGYLQAEVMVSRYSSSDSTAHTQISLNPNGYYDGFDVLEKNEYTSIVLTAVPVSYRYDINKFVGVGGGIQVNVDASVKTVNDARYQYFLTDADFRFRERNPQLDYTESEEDKDSFTRFHTGVFADLILGSARIGPALGVRYIYNFHTPREQWQFYAVWKF